MSSLLISTHLYEKRPLKKPKLGPPDVYPQDPKQKEDELTAINVKQGYSSSTVLADEYGSARNANITPNRFGEYFSAILSKKHELNTLSDTSRKKQQINKDSTLYVTSKTKNYVDGWFKDLATNAKSLAHLSRKVPVFNKKDEIFTTLYEFSVPMFKAEWFIKMSCAHQMAMSESNNKSKKRQMPDPSQEWTTFLCKFLKEHYLRISESINSNTHSSSLSNSLHMQPPPDTEELLKQWNYYVQLARHLYEQGLLDRHDFLTWLLELFEKIKSVDDPLLNLIVPMLVQYVDEFTQSEFLSRRLAYYSSKKINQLVVEFNVELHTSLDSDKENLSSANGSQNNSTTEKSSSANSTPTKSSNDPSSSSLIVNGLVNATALSTCFREIVSCSRHRNILFSLCTIVQVITLDCPTALIWLNFPPIHDSSSKHSSSSPFYGSPLDFLPCEPSNLPMPPSEHNDRLRSHLRNAEELIRYRSKMSEKKWFFRIFESINSPKAMGSLVNRLLRVLDYLDKHLFDKVSSSNSVDSLYNKIFHPSHSQNDHSSASHLSNTQNGESALGDLYGTDSKNNPELSDEEVAIVRLLCEWAVTTKRLGEHRARVVAKLLERRQNEITAEKEQTQSEAAASTITSFNNDPIKMEVDETGDKSQTTSPTATTGGQLNQQQPAPPPLPPADTVNTPVYQNILFDFLDSYAPVHEDKTFGLYSTNSFGSSNVVTDNKQAFNNLILLFSELIRHEVFSHDAYMCTLISRGHFANPPITALVSSANSNPSSKTSNDDLLAGLVPSLTNITDPVTNGGIMGSTIPKSTSSSSLPMFDPLSNNSTMNSNDQSGCNWLSMGNDALEEDVDEDLDKILQHIKAGQSGLNDQTDLLLPDAMESDKEDDANGPNSNGGNNGVSNPTSLSDLPGVTTGKNSTNNDQTNSTSRHLLYTLHFPLPQDEFFVHECNQRHILLYGVGKTKDEARHSVKKVTKEIQKLFNRKSSMDISDGGKVKKHVIKEGFNFENAIAKFQNLSIFDQQVVTNTCASTVLEMLNGVVSGSANHLPLIESIAYLFDLMEVALNVHGLTEFIVQMLKELVEVEQQLQQKCPLLARPYCTSIGLYIVGVLYRYHSYMIVSTEDIVAIFDGLWKLVRHVGTPSDCSSAERCIFYYVYDLYSCCSHVLKKYHDSISPIISKIKSMAPTKSDSEHSYVLNTPCHLTEYLKNPKLKVDPNHIRQLNENASDRYSLAFNAICCIVETNDMDQLNEMSVLCAELTASCSQLSSDWFNAFRVLFNPNKRNEYSPLLNHINIGDRTIYDNLAVFILILVARRCFSLEELFPEILIPSLLLVTQDHSEEAERCAFLSCHLILCLFKYYDSPLAISNSAMNSSFVSSSRYSLTSPGPLGLPPVAPPSTGGQKPPFVIKYACDRYLLGGALSSLRLEAILTTLKAINLIGIQSQMDRKSSGEKNFKSEKSELSFNEILKPINDDDFSDIGLLSQISSKSKIDSLDKPSLFDFAKHVLRQSCLQDWLHDRCLRGLISTSIPDIYGLIFDKRIPPKDSQYLLNMLCNHKQQIVPATIVSEKCDSKQIISRVFQNLDEWSIRHSWLQLHLIYEQLYASSQSYSSSEVTTWLDTLARAVVEYFQNSSQTDPILDPKQLTLFTSKSSTKSTQINNGLNFGSSSNVNNSERIWLVASLISKLPSQLQSKILRIAASIFDSNNWIVYATSQSSSMSSKSKSGSKNTNSMSGITINSQNPTSALLSYQPFISLILMCLNSKEDYKDATSSILNSMYVQIGQCVNEKLSEDIRVKHAVQEGLQLRLSLVGAMFDLIQMSSSLTSDWAILLLQLIIYNIVDPHINYENFTTVLDMLTSLMHTTLMSVAPEQREECKKQHQNLIKKLKKELNNERAGLGLRMAKQLLPIPKLQTEVIACEPMGSLVDTKGNKIAGFDSIDKKQGLQVSEKQKLSPWDLLEGHKNPAPLGWTWFGALRIERKPMRTEENFCLMARHNHCIRKSTAYYMEPPPLPPEDEPAPPPPPLLNQTPTIPSMPPFGGANMPPLGATGPMGPTNGPNIVAGGGVPNSPHLPNLGPPPPQGPPFNSGNLVHSLQAQPSSHHPMPGGSFHSPHMHHMPGMPPNALPHGLSQGPPMGPNGGPGGPGPGSGPMHPGNMQPQPPGLPQPPQQQPPPHLAGMPGTGNDHGPPMGQPAVGGHHMGMMNSHMNNNSMMPMDVNRDLMMDGLPGPGNTVPMHAAPPPPGMQPGGLGPMRPNMNPMPQQPPMNPNVNVNMPVGGGRAATPKTTKPKAPRRRRQNTKNQPANGNTTPVPVPGQQTPPIRMNNSFDNFNQAPVNAPMGQSVGQANNWSYQQQVGNQQAPPQQPNMPGQSPVNASNQTFYQQAGPPGPAQAGPTMMPPQAQQARFAEAPHPMPNNSKVRLRAMLNTRHPNTNQFNMGPSAPAPAGPANAMNNSQMMNNSGNMMPGGQMYQARPPMQMMQQRPQMRPQGPVTQANQSMAPMANQNNMFSQQQMNQSGNSGGPMMHHMQQQQQQQGNFAGAQQNMNFNNNAMQSMDSSGMQPMGGGGGVGGAAGGGPGGFQGQTPQQANMMMRPQMQMNAQQMQQQQGNQGQFMQQRSQYNNVSMGKPGQMNHNFGQQQQQMMNSGPQQQQQWSQMNAPRAQMTQLQRQLSSNQGPQGQPPQGPYHQVPY